MGRRGCSRTACPGRAVATLTYNYAEQLAVLGPLAAQRTPGAHDLCERHSRSTSTPNGWELMRLPDLDAPSEQPVDDLLALADAIREVGLRHDDPPVGPPGRPQGSPDLGESVVVLAERGHLRVIADR